MKISMRAKDADGVIKKLTFILGLSPSDVNWVKQFERQKWKYLMQHNICSA